MEKGDIQSYDSRGFGVVFEGLLASEPSGLRGLISARSKDWDKIIRSWSPNDLPLKALADHTNRLGIGAEVYTFLDPAAPEAIDKWLVRKGISVPVHYYETVNELSYDLRFKRSIRVIYVPQHEQAKIIGVRATVTSTETAWVI
jgi:hypothetical protein